MRKFLVAAILLPFFALGLGVARAAPDALKCTEKFDPRKRPAPGTVGSSMNCLSDEIFILDGAELVNGAPLVDCAESGIPPTKDPKNCFFGNNQANYINIDNFERGVSKVLELMKTKVPDLTQWDEIVVFTADFGPVFTHPSFPGQTFDPGPIFFRAANAAFLRINPVAGIGPVDDMGRETSERDPAKPYIGMINAGNSKLIPVNPATGTFAPCGPARPPAANPAPQPSPAMCAPGLYNYFDALAQATAMLYGPYLRIPPAEGGTFGGNLASRPATKLNLVVMEDTRGVNTSAKLMDGGPETKVWNGLIDTRGSLLGGNTFLDNGNRTWSVVRPPPYRGVSAPFEGTHMLRFQPIDLYVMGFLPWSAVPPLRSFMHATPANVAVPSDFGTVWNATVGPNMGIRPGGVSIRAVRHDTNPVPKSIDFANIVAINGERNPPHATARQSIRQLWVMVTKPEAVMDLVAASSGGAKKEDQLKEQATQLANLQKYRRAYNQYFHALTGYRGKLISTFEGDIDDSPIFEFGGARDDEKIFQAQGSLKLALPGPEEIPNSGGKVRTVLRVTETKGPDGSIRFNPEVTPEPHRIRIEGKQEIGSAPNNVLTVRMRVPPNPGLLSELKKNPAFEGGFFASFVFEGGGRSWTVRVPKLNEAFLVPDGKFRNYAVDLSSENDFKAATWTGFTFTPSNREARDIEIEFIKIGFSENVKDDDKSCLNAEQPDGWLAVYDNCPTLFNPSQEDGNDDGVGDACEDYDGDNRLNFCDNCPVVTNTSQRDGNNNQIGDACDGSTSEGCLGGATVARRGPPVSALFWVSVTAVGVMLVRSRRPRKRNRK
jgi:hypothetical protein